MKKNFLYHCYISDLNQINKSTAFNLKCLKEYINKFDGKKIICISIDNIESNSKEILQSKFDVFKKFDELYITKNDSCNRESESLMTLLESVENCKNSITFYAHTKGSTHNLDLCLANWILSMYFFNLEENYLEKIENALKNQYTVSGVLKKDCHWDSPEIKGDWHYSGAFFWFNDKLFNCDWKNFSKGRMSLESYLGQRINSKEAFCTFVDKPYNFHIDENLWETEISLLNIDEISFQRYKKLLKNLSE